MNCGDAAAATWTCRGDESDATAATWKFGTRLRYDRKLFGRGQVIFRAPPQHAGDPAVLWAGSDGRGDGAAMGFC